MLKLEPYIRFNGDCEEAFNFYKSVFKGEFTYIMRYKDYPENDWKITPKDEEKVLHIAFPIGKTVVLMGSDIPSESSITPGDNIIISISERSEDEVKRLFSGLSDGGKVKMPLQKTFWADLYGELTDKFGINWMVSRAKGEDA